jgi:hypothetical protein
LKIQLPFSGSTLPSMRAYVTLFSTLRLRGLIVSHVCFSTFQETRHDIDRKKFGRFDSRRSLLRIGQRRMDPAIQRQGPGWLDTQNQGLPRRRKFR